LKVQVQILECQKMHIMIYAIKLSTFGWKGQGSAKQKQTKYHTFTLLIALALALYQNSLRIPLSSPPFTELRSEKLTNTDEIDVCALCFILQHFVSQWATFCNRNSSVWAVLAVRAVRGKSRFEEFWATFEGGFFQLFLGKKIWNFFRSILASALKSFMKWLLYIFKKKV